MYQWHVATVGHLSRNKFWGEDEYCCYHPVLATSTVIQTPYGNILVDPSQKGEEMQKSVFDCCGLKPEEIHIIYSTHFHNDHWLGVDAFPNAEFYMAKGDLESLMSLKDYVPKEDARVLERVKPAEGELVDGILLIPLPGHTAGLQGLLFEGPEGKILVSGDSVMGYEFFQAKEGYFYSYSLELCRKSIEKAAQIADYIIPGHGKYFSVQAYPFHEQIAALPQKDAENPDVCYTYNLNTTIGEILNLENGFELFQKFLSPELTKLTLKMSASLPIGVLIKSMGLKPEQAKEFLLRIQNKD